MEQAFIDGFIDYINNMSANTISSYTSDIKNFVNFTLMHRAKFDHQTLESMSIQDIRAWLTHRLVRENVSKRSNNRALSALKVLYKYLRDVHKIDNKVFLSLQHAKNPTMLPKPPSSENINKIINSIDTNSWVGLRDKAIIMMLYGCGMRISEVLSIQTEQIEPNTIFIKIVGKGNKERTIPILSEVLTATLEYKENRPMEHKFLFIGEHGKKLSRNYFANKIRQISSCTIHAHMLRHSCASHLLNNGGSIKAIQQLLGHASLSSTQIYANVTKNKMIQEYNAHHPHAIKHENNNN